MKKNNKIYNSVIINSIGSFIYLFCQWIITYIIIWINGYNDAGIFSIAMSLGNTFYAIQLFGMRNYQSSDLSGEHTEKTYIFSRIFTCFLGIIYSLIFTLIKGYDWNLFLCINAYVLFKTTEAIVDLTHGSLQKKWLYKYIGFSYISRGLISIIVFSISLLLFKNLLLSIILMTVFVFAFILLYDFKKYKENISINGSFNIIDIKYLLIKCIPFAVFLIIFSFISAYPRLEISEIYGSDILGIYTTYANIAIIVQVAANFLINPFITLLAEIKKKNDFKKVINVIVKATILIIMVGLIALVGCSIFGKLFFYILFNDSIIDYIYLLNPMIIISLLTALISLYSCVLIVFRRFKELIIINVINLLEIVLLSKYFLVKYNLAGINYFIIASYISVVILYIFCIVKIISLEEKRY